MRDKPKPPAAPQSEKTKVPEPILRELDRRAELLMTRRPAQPFPTSSGRAGDEA
jgi:hypothetical protein